MIHDVGFGQTLPLMGGDLHSRHVPGRGVREECLDARTADKQRGNPLAADALEREPSLAVGHDQGEQGRDVVAGPVSEHLHGWVGGSVPLQDIEPLVERGGVGPKDADDLDCGAGDGPALDVDHPSTDRDVVSGEAEHWRGVAAGRLQKRRPVSLGHGHHLGRSVACGLHVPRRQAEQAVGARAGQRDRALRPRGVSPAKVIDGPGLGVAPVHGRTRDGLAVGIDDPDGHGRTGVQLHRRLRGRRWPGFPWPPSGHL